MSGNQSGGFFKSSICVCVYDFELPVTVFGRSFCFVGGCTLSATGNAQSGCSAPRATTEARPTSNAESRPRMSLPHSPKFVVVVGANAEIGQCRKDPAEHPQDRAGKTMP